MKLTKSVTYTYGKATLTRFEFDFRRVLYCYYNTFSKVYDLLQSLLAFS